MSFLCSRNNAGTRTGYSSCSGRLEVAMNFAAVTCVVALAVAGAAYADPDLAGAARAADAAAQQHPFQDGAANNYGTRSAKYAAEVQAAHEQMRLSCAADHETLCAGKTGNDRGRCMWYHRLTVSRACRQAMDKVKMAGEGRL